MKPQGTLKLEFEAAEKLQNLLGVIQAIEDIHVDVEDIAPAHDLTAHFVYDGRPRTMICEVKSNGQPRFVRDAIFRLLRRVDHANLIPLVIAPFLSEQAQQICREEGVGYLDLEGNSFIAFDSVYIERKVATQPKAERRALRSLFRPKSARILRTLLREPRRPWRVVELADAAGVSVGHVSTVGKALRNRDWAEQTEEGIFLIDPDGLLDAWVEDYEPPEGRRERLYTHLHGAALDKSLREAMAESSGRHIVLGSYSAAEWLAPYGRNPNRYIYADATGLDLLKSKIHLSKADKGGNVLVWLPDEDGVIADAVRPLPDVACTSPVQTYLDLMNSGDRGREAADHLRMELLRWA